MPPPPHTLKMPTNTAAPSRVQYVYNNHASLAERTSNITIVHVILLLLYNACARVHIIIVSGHSAGNAAVCGQTYTIGVISPTHPHGAYIRINFGRGIGQVFFSPTSDFLSFFPFIFSVMPIRYCATYYRIMLLLLGMYYSRRHIYLDNKQ